MPAVVLLNQLSILIYAFHCVLHVVVKIVRGTGRSLCHWHRGVTDADLPLALLVFAKDQSLSLR